MVWFTIPSRNYKELRINAYSSVPTKQGERSEMHKTERDILTLIGYLV